MAEDETYLNGGNRRPVQRVRTKRGGWTKARRTRFLKVLAESCNVTMASRAAGSVSGAYDLRRRDPAFARLWDEALDIGYHRLETMLLQRALEGVNDIDVGALADESDREAEAAAEQADAAETKLGGDAAATAHRGRQRPGAIPRDSLARGDVQLALALLNRRREGGAPRKPGRTLLTADEVDALLLKKLDHLARKQCRPE